MFWTGRPALSSNTNHKMQLPHLLTRALLVCASALPACYLGALIYKTSVDVPFIEQWTVAFYFEKLFKGTLTLSDLFQQMNEFRQFFPNLLFLSLGWLTRWNVRYEMLFIFLLACLISFNLYRLGALTLGDDNYVLRLLALLITNTLIFSPLQYDTWLNGIQVVYLVPMACLTSGLLIATSSLSVRTKFLICICLSTVSTFSSANGILCWAILLPVLILPCSRAALFEKRWMLTAWLAGFISNGALYFYDYQKPAGNPSLLAAVRHPLQGALYYLAYLGTPLGWGASKVTVPIGLILVTLFALACVYLWANRRDHALVRRMTVWLALGSFTLLTGLMITASRLGYGVGHSSSLRYLAFSLYLVACLAHLAPVVWQDLHRKGKLDRTASHLRHVLTATLVLALVMHLRFYPSGAHFMNRLRLDREYTKACLLFVNILPDTCVADPEAMPPNVNFVKLRANALDTRGFLRPALIKSATLEDIEATETSPGAGHNVFENLNARGDDTYEASGEAARAANVNAPADVVLLAYEREDDDGDGEKTSTVFKFSEPCAQHKPPTLRADEVDCTSLRWRATFSANEIPDGKIRLTAWAFDAETGRAFRLAGSHTINKSGSLPANVKSDD